MVKKRKKDFLLPVGVKILVQVLRSEGAEKLGYKTLYKFSSKRSVSICKLMILVLPLALPFDTVFVEMIPNISNSFTKSKILL